MTPASHIVVELGLSVAIDGPLAVGRAAVVPEICVPGSVVPRTSVLATWADVITGTLCISAIAPRIPLTLDLEVQVFEPPVEGDTVTIEASMVKLGRTVMVTEARFHVEGSAAPAALALVSFIASPDPSHVFPPDFRPPLRQEAGRLSMPFAERAGSVVENPGTAEVPRKLDGLNASGGIQGGLVALAAEEAAASLSDTPVFLESLTLRYLRPFAVGPARATAERHGDTCLVRLTDAGVGRLSALATARLAAAPRLRPARP
ncbi:MULTISPECIES: hotdog domain-containing protein [Pseudofrankia]|uniref:hotdog domain-containing protein n=1 Tax=Pseudofrankia TaxID=2994363 RepID=UPI0002F637F6|nr:MULTISPECIES: hotdog domain-containing protein [Pseudofrankia]